jgi:CHAD domain-containing protein
MFPCWLQHLHDTFGVNLEVYHDLRYTARGWRNAEEFKLAKEIVILK